MARIKCISLFFVLVLGLCPVHALQLTRAIISSDTNPLYIEFWPVVARAWKQIVGIQPTLFLVAPKDFVIDETLGDVIRFEPLPDIPTALQAQLIRLFGAAFFPDDGCVISDIDMIPLNKDYFVLSAEPYADDQFVTYLDRATRENVANGIYRMCYNAAKGRVFGEIFNINSLQDAQERIVEWHNLNHKWFTDEILLAKYLNAWNELSHRHVKLGYAVMPFRMIDRNNNGRYFPDLLREKYYIDAHVMRPYSQYKEYIDGILECVGVTCQA